MCVILVKRKGVKMPSKRELKRAADYNHDGCGFVSSNGLYYRSMDFEDFYNHLKGVGVNDACIIHFRWATTGSPKVSNCHPFVKNGLYFAHNGILKVRTENDMTDSETVFLKELEPAIRQYGIQSDDVRFGIKCMIGYSKFAFMQDGEIYTFGNFVNVNGVLYSNLNHGYTYAY